MKRLLLLVVLALPVAARADRPVLDITGTTFTPFPLAVTAPQGTASTASTVDETLLYDLSVCGVFQLVPRQAFLADAAEGVDPERIAWNRWSDVGAQGLLKVQVAASGNETKATAYLFDVTGKKKALEETASGSDPRRVAHKLADAVWRYYTHEPGAFDTRVAFIRKEGSVKAVGFSDFDGQNATLVGRGELDLLPAWSPGGSRLVYTHYRRTPQYAHGHPELWTADLGKPPEAFFAKGNLNTGASFSPDGKQMAFTMSQGDGNTEIWSIGTDAMGLKRLTNSPAIDNSPAFSPDGSKLAFVSDREGNPQIFVMNRDGSNVVRVTRQGTYNQEPAWSPRGQEIAFTARDERAVFDIFVVNVDTGEIRRVTQNQGQNEHPTWSPNGRMLAFSSTRSGKQQIWVSSQDGRVQKKASPPDNASYSDPAWGPLRK